eukprot:11498491-Alexandrium_andersonii.AAC.1
MPLDARLRQTVRVSYSSGTTAGGARNASRCEAPPVSRRVMIVSDTYGCITARKTSRVPNKCRLRHPTQARTHTH